MYRCNWSCYFLIFSLSIEFFFLSIFSCPFDQSHNLLSNLQPSYPAFCRKTHGRPPISNVETICASHYGILTEFNAVAKNYTSMGLLQLSNLLGKATRLVFHDVAEADLSIPGDMMGPDGCLSGDTESTGLLEPNSLVFTVFESIWQKYCDKISRGDFWVFLAKIAFEYADPTNILKIPFQYGRIDSKDCSAGVGRLPSGIFGFNQIKKLFVQRLGLTMNDTVTLLGAHSLGHTHIANSGFGQDPRTANPAVHLNSWDNTPYIFDNLYYQNMNNFNWLSVQFQPGKTTFIRAELPFNHGGPTILLNVDIAMNFNNTVPFLEGQDCGPNANPDGGVGCKQPFGYSRPETAALVEKYSQNKFYFLKAFALAFVKMVTVGYSVGNTGTPGPLGNLKPIDLSKCPSTFRPTGEPTFSPQPTPRSSVSPSFRSSRQPTKPSVSPSTFHPTSSKPHSISPTIRTKRPTKRPITASPVAQPTEEPSFQPSQPTPAATMRPSIKGNSFSPSTSPTSNRPQSTTTFGPTASRTSVSVKPSSFQSPTLSPTRTVTTNPSAKTSLRKFGQKSLPLFPFEFSNINYSL